MIDHVVVDVEIQRTIEETPGGWDATDSLGVACACLWEYQTQRMRIYGPEDVQALRERLLKADRISGFNTFRFDFPVIWGISRKDWYEATGPVSPHTKIKQELKAKNNDLLERIWVSLGLDPDRFDPKTHGGWSLDNVAQGTLGGVGKIGYGGNAPKWFQAGQWARVVNYCADDTALERDLTDFIDRYRFVVNGNTQRVVRIP